MAAATDQEEVATRSVTMRDLPVRILTSSTKERRAVFQDLQEFLNKENIPEAAVKGIPRLLPLTLPRYNDSQSRSLVEGLVVTLARRCPEISFGPLASAFLGISQAARNVHSTTNLSRTYLTALRWLCSIIRGTSRFTDVVKDDDFQKVVEAVSYMLRVILAAKHPSHVRKALRQLSFTWLQAPEILDRFTKTLSQMEPTYHTVLLSSCIIKHLCEVKNLQQIEQIKGGFLDGFIKSVVGSKTRPPLYVLEFSAPLLRHVTHNEFPSILMPAMQRALLRNPELILQGVSEVLSSLTLDLSQYSLELGKTLCTYLHSKEDNIREDASTAIKSLARQCSDPEAIKKLLHHFVDILNGSEGKLTLTVQRVGILSGIGTLSHNTAVATSAQTLANAAAIELIKILKSEVHEGTVVSGMAMLALWCAQFSTQVPPQLVDFFMEGISAKASTSAIRYAYLNCMNTAFHGDAIAYNDALIVSLLKAVDKSVAQSSQTAVVAEGLLAALLLLKFNAADYSLESSLTGLWNVLLDFDKQVFNSEKFLLNASEEVLGHLVTFIERLCLNFPEKLTSLGPYRRALIFALTRPSYTLRTHASSAATKMLSVSGSGRLAVELLRELSEFIHDKRTKVFGSDSNGMSDQNEFGNCVQQADGAAGGAYSINACFGVECFVLLCSTSGLDLMDRDNIALESLVGVHHPAIVALQPMLWVKLARQLEVDPVVLLRKNLDQIWTSVLDCTPFTPTYCNVVRTVVRLCPVAALALIVPHVRKELTASEVSNVTNDDYGIFLTPPDELYDQSVIQSGREEVAESKNIKRESKLYSFKEQMEEIELRKELEAKKRAAKGMKVKPELNPKQLEMMKAQLTKESVIRDHIHQLHLRTTQAIAIASAAAQANPVAVSVHCRDLVDGLLVALRSPVTAAHAMSLYTEMRSCVFTGNLNNFGLLVCHVTLRLLEPCCELDAAWNQEKLVDAAIRTISILHSTTVRAMGGEYDELKESFREALSAPAFAYAFPLLDMILRNGGQRVNFDEPTLVKGLEIIVEHAQMRTIPGVPNQELMNPAFLPRKHMKDLLIHLIESTSGEIQKLCGRVLLQVSESGSGRPGCATATADEIRSLLLALQSPVVVARHFALVSLTSLVDVLKTLSSLGKDPPIQRRVWVSRFDPDENNRDLTNKLWTNLGIKDTADLCRDLLSDIAHPEDFVREAAAEGLADLFVRFPKQVNPILDSLLKMYKAGSKVPPPILDNFGRVVSEKPIDEWEGRSGVAVALRRMASHLPESGLSNLMNFFFEGLRDLNTRVQHEMLEASLEIVNVHGKNNVAMLLKLFQNFLTKTPKSSKYDTVRQSVVVLMGSLARHLDADDPQVRPIVTRLIETLSTPSQQVQEAVANCLPPLVTSLRDEAPSLVRQLLQKLVGTGSYGERRGAAYGIAGLVKGLGILSLKQLGVMDTLNEAIGDKKRYQAREGALLAFEMLCHMLGRLFEPYVVHILPTMLVCFGDSNHYVREAAEETAKTVMGQLSVHGVKMVLPVLMRGLEDDSWRTKAGSIELLGAMAFCAPKQLGSCLPSIVPRLIEVLSDSHVKVQEAGAQALKQIGSVIRNPEIQALVSILLEALQDPSRKTSLCLQTLLDTKFVHFIDAPSLALIMPVVQRAFQDRSTETRKMAAQIIGNMYSVTDKKDLAPYLPNVIPGLKQSLLDPVPEVRSVAARALGAMVKGMGEGIYDELLPWLMQTLTSEASSVDRSGAAQGLSEVVGGRGVEKLHKLMPDIIATADRSDVAPHVKDGYIMTFIYMPVVFQREFTPYIGQIINPILKALADESEFVRETAFRAGQRIVNMYAESAIALLLPELEKGLFDDNWRIRYSSIQLLGDLLYKISGVSGKMTTETADEDDNFGTEHSHKAIMGALGRERRNRVLAGLYMGRSDLALMVRQSALHVWKVVVTNTPRTLREILPTLFTLLLGCLASTSHDKRQVAARTLGDLVRKLGERVLPDIIPILERGLESGRADQRQGVCIGLSEIMASTSREMVMTFVDSLVPTVRKALCDPLPEVRQAAAKTFDSLHNTVGHRALDDILSPLLKQLGSSEVGEYALDGLRQVMAIKSKVVLPYLVPQLTSPPVNTKALSILASVAGDALTKHLGRILPALLVALSESCDTSNEQQELEYCEAVILSVSGSSGVHMVIDELLEATRSGNVGVRRASTMLLYSYCAQSKANYSQHVPQLLRGLVHLFIDSDERVLRLAWEALNAVTKDLDPNDQLQHVANVRQAVRFTVSDLGRNQLLPGFCLPKGIASILPIFREAILNGSPELKEQAAIGLGEVIQLTNAEALKPSVVNITGPLIRVLGDRFAWSVRVAVLETLTLLLAKVGVMLKPFLPQLQTTFLKALSDPNRQVRLKAAAALSRLIVIHTKADPLFTELHANVRNTEDLSIRETMLHALRSVVSPAGDKMSDAVRRSVVVTLQQQASMFSAAAGCLGALCRTLPNDELNDLVNSVLLPADDGVGMEWEVRHGCSVALMVALEEAPHRILTPEWIERTIRILLSYMTADRIPIILTGVRGVGLFLKHQLLLKDDGQWPATMIQVFSKLMNHCSNEVKQLVAQVGSYLAHSATKLGELPDTLVRPLVPMLVNGTKEKNTAVKANSEFALVAILRLRAGDDEVYQRCSKLLDAGAKEALTDVVLKVLRKVASQPEPKEEPLDDTLLT